MRQPGRGRVQRARRGRWSRRVRCVVLGGLVAVLMVIATTVAGSLPASASVPAFPSAPVPPAPDLALLAGLDPAPHPLPGVTPRVRCVAPAAPGSPTPSVAAAPWAQQRLRFTDAWRFTRGAGQTVAVIDTGVSPHPRLGDRLVDGGDFVGTNGGLSDCDGHGTLVAGIIAAAPDPATGFVGVAPDARVLSIRQSSATVSSRTSDGTPTAGGGNVTTLAEAVVRAVRLGAGVINISEAACVPAATAAASLAPLRAAVHYAATADRVVVAAAGNAGTGSCRQSDGGATGELVAPAWFSDDVLSVGYTRRDGLPAPQSIRGSWVSLSAPGSEIVSLDPTGPGVVDRIAPIGSTQAVPIEGTSFATPYVAGVVALVRARYPGLSARQVRDRVMATATHPAETGGRDDAVGAGTVDPGSALADVRGVEFGARPVGPSAGRVDLGGDGDAHSGARTVALIGSGSAVAALVGTGVGVLVARRGRQSRRGGRAPHPARFVPP